MEYFSHSPFFDRQSTNQQLKMQTVHTGAEGLNEAEELRCGSFFRVSSDLPIVKS